MIIDPFCGSGAIAEAAIRTGRSYVGCDIDQAAVQVTAGRIAQVRADIACGKVALDLTYSDVMSKYVTRTTIHSVLATAPGAGKSRKQDDLDHSEVVGSLRAAISSVGSLYTHPPADAQQAALQVAVGGKRGGDREGEPLGKRVK